MNPDCNHRNHGIKPEESVELASTGDKTAVIVDVGRQMPLRSLPRDLLEEFILRRTPNRIRLTYLAKLRCRMRFGLMSVAIVDARCQIRKNRKGRP